MRTSMNKALVTFLCSATLLAGCGGGGGGGDSPNLAPSQGASPAPDQFSFTPKSNVAPSTLITSDPVTITGLTASAGVTVVGGSYSVGCTGPYISTASTINNNDTVCAQHTSAATAGTATNTTLTVGGVSAAFTSTTAGATVTSSSLMPFVTGAGDLKLLDPAAPIDGTNPKTVDTGLAPPPLGAGCNDCFPQAQTFKAGTVSGTTISNLRTARMAYTKRADGSDAGGSVFKLDMTQGASNLPVQISAINNACRIVKAGTSDLASVDNSAVVVERAGGDGLCSTTADNTVTVIRLNSAATDTGTDIPLALVGGNPMYAQTDSSGVITGYVSFEVAGPNSFLLVHRDPSLATPVTLQALDQTTGANIEQSDLTHLYVTAIPTNDGLKLYRVESAGTLSPVLYSFVEFNAGNPIQGGLRDTSNLYFADGNKLLRVPVDSTTLNAELVTTMDPTLRIGNRGLDSSTTPGRVVFEAQDDAISTAGGVFSAATNAANVPATTLANNPAPIAPLTDAGARAGLLLATNGLAYINLNNHGGPPDALKISTDGTGASTVTTAYWAGSNSVTTSDLATNYVLPTQSIFLARRIIDVDGINHDTLSVVDPANGVEGITLGTADGVANSETVGMKVAGSGRYSIVRIETNRAGTIDDDVSFFDAQTAGSLTPLAATPGSNDIPLNN